MFTPRFEPRSLADDQVASQGGTRVQTWRDLSDVVCAYGSAGPGWWSMELPRLGTFRLDLASPDTIRIFAAAGASRERLDDLYRRTVVPLFMQALGCETLHASAVTGSSGVLAFCGERGAGKSTIAYALARRGFAQYADDTLVLEVADATITTQPLPFTPRLRPASADFFNGAGPSHAMTGSSEPRKLAGLFILRRSGEGSRSEILRLSPSHALQAVLAHAHCFEPGNAAARRRLLQNYLEISTRVAIFAVTFAPGLDRLDGLLDDMLAAAGEQRLVVASA